MGQSPLKIESYHLRSLKYQLKKEFEHGLPDGIPETVEPEIQVNVESGHNKENDNHWRIVIEVSGGEEPMFPYTFEISFVGFFKVADSFPEDKRETLIRVNGPSILFAAAREFLSIVTARSPYPPIMLPSISFVPDQAEKPAGKSPAKKKTAKPVKSTTQKKTKKNM